MPVIRETRIGEDIAEFKEEAFYKESFNYD